MHSFIKLSNLSGSFSVHLIQQVVKVLTSDFFQFKMEQYTTVFKTVENIKTKEEQKDLKKCIKLHIIILVSGS